MLPFYVLLFLLGLLLAGLLLQLVGRGRGLRGAPYRRRVLLTEAEQDWRAAVAAAAGPGFEVWPRVAAAALLQPLPRLDRATRALARAALADGVLDLVIAADGDPLCVVQLQPARRARTERRRAAHLIEACAAAGLPVIELPLEQAPAPGELTRLVQQAIGLAGRKQSAPAAPPPDADEEDALARLSDALREPDPSSPPSARGA